MNQLRCIQCNRIHKATSEKFPIARRENRLNKETGTLEPVIIGYLCKWCILKRIEKEESRNKTGYKKEKPQSIKVKPQKINIIRRIIDAFRYKRTP